MGAWLPVIILVALLVLAFEIWMITDVITNKKISDKAKIWWVIGMLIIHPFVAIVYFFTDHRKHFMKKGTIKFSPKNIFVLVILLLVVGSVGCYIYNHYHHHTTYVTQHSRRATYGTTNPRHTTSAYATKSPVNLASCQKEATYTKQQAATFISNFQKDKAATLVVSYTCGGPSIASGGYWVNNSLSASNKAITDNQRPIYDASPPVPGTKLHCTATDISASSAVLDCGGTKIVL